jgi:Ca2+-binding EF-hand superfamily protein
MRTTSRNTGDNNALSKLQPAQVRELREGFQTLDRDSDGLVGRDDVADMLAQLGERTRLDLPAPLANTYQECHPTHPT